MEHCLNAHNMYLQSARQSLSRAADAWHAVSIVEEQLTDFFLREEQALHPELAPRERGDIEERFSIELVDGLQPELEAAVAKAIAETAMVHIQCAAALEAFINTVTEPLLGRAEWEQFDKLSIPGKWLFHPMLLGRPRFSAGEEPMQGITQVVGYRNRLMHYRPRWEPIEWGKVMQVGSDGLGLTPEAATRSLEVASAAIARVLGWRGEVSLLDELEDQSIFRLRLSSPKT